MDRWLRRLLIGNMATKAKNQPKEESQSKVAELEELVKRTVADYHNLENRIQEERKSIGMYAATELIKRLLPAFDTLFLAAKFTNDQGVILTAKQLLDALQKEGVEKINTESVKFDPSLMECVEVVNGEKDQVVEELAPGFIMGGKLLRAARVKVGSGEKSEQVN